MAHKTHKLHHGTWIEIERPDDKDLEFLKEQFPFFHPTNLEDSMQRVSHAKMDIHKEYLFMSEVLPVTLEFGKKSQNFEISMFLTEGVLITITHEETTLLKKKYAETEEMATVELPETPELLMYRFFETLYEISGKTIERIALAIQRVDDSILNEKSPQIIRQIAILQRNLIYFITTLDVSIPYFTELESKNIGFSDVSMKEYWGDIVDRLTGQRDVLKDYELLLATLAQAHEMFITHRTNSIVNVLTVFSVIFLPLNLIAGMYGMNFDFLPFAHNQNGFVTTVLVMILLAGSMFAFFKYRKWI